MGRLQWDEHDRVLLRKLRAMFEAAGPRDAETGRPLTKSGSLLLLRNKSAATSLHNLGGWQQQQARGLDRDDGDWGFGEAAAAAAAADDMDDNGLAAPSTSNNHAPQQQQQQQRRAMSFESFVLALDPASKRTQQLFTKMLDHTVARKPEHTRRAAAEQAQRSSAAAASTSASTTATTTTSAPGARASRGDGALGGPRQPRRLIAGNRLSGSSTNVAGPGTSATAGTSSSWRHFSFADFPASEDVLPLQRGGAGGGDQENEDDDGDDDDDEQRELDDDRAATQLERIMMEMDDDDDDIGQRGGAQGGAFRVEGGWPRRPQYAIRSIMTREPMTDDDDDDEDDDPDEDDLLLRGPGEGPGAANNSNTSGMANDFQSLFAVRGPLQASSTSASVGPSTSSATELAAADPSWRDLYTLPTRRFLNDTRGGARPSSLAPGSSSTSRRAPTAAAPSSSSLLAAPRQGSTSGSATTTTRRSASEDDRRIEESGFAAFARRQRAAERGARESAVDASTGGVQSTATDSPSPSSSSPVFVTVSSGTISSSLLGNGSLSVSLAGHARAQDATTSSMDISPSSAPVLTSQPATTSSSSHDTALAISASSPSARGVIVIDSREQPGATSSSAQGGAEQQSGR